MNIKHYKNLNKITMFIVWVINQIGENMSNGTQILKPLLKEGLIDIFGGEDLLIEAAKDLIRDDIKEHIREKLEANPELKKEFKDAIGMYFEAKLKEAYANIKLVKAGAKLGLDLIPDSMKSRLSKEVEEELTKILEKTL